MLVHIKVCHEEIYALSIAVCCCHMVPVVCQYTVQIIFFFCPKIFLESLLIGISSMQQAYREIYPVDSQFNEAVVCISYTEVLRCKCLGSGIGSAYQDYPIALRQWTGCLYQAGSIMVASNSYYGTPAIFR